MQLSIQAKFTNNENLSMNQDDDLSRGCDSSIAAMFYGAVRQGVDDRIEGSSEQ